MVYILKPLFSVLNCPALSPPVNGMILSPGCGNYYGATCQVGCMAGFNLQGGSATVTCQKNGNGAQWSPATSTLQCKGKVTPPYTVMVMLLQAPL